MSKSPQKVSRSNRQTRLIVVKRRNERISVEDIRSLSQTESVRTTPFKGSPSQLYRRKIAFLADRKGLVRCPFSMHSFSDVYRLHIKETMHAIMRTLRNASPTSQLSFDINDSRHGVGLQYCCSCNFVKCRSPTAMSAKDFVLPLIITATVSEKSTQQ